MGDAISYKMSALIIKGVNLLNGAVHEFMFIYSEI